MEFVIKISKFCNLRCSYCYEYPYLGHKRRLSLEEIRIIFKQVRAVLKRRKDSVANFIWHGGEPLLIEPAYYESIWKIQKEIFKSSKISIENSVQTNLTLLSDEYLEKIKGGLFDSFGVSYDLNGQQRVNVAGKQVNAKVLQNMQRLLENKVPFGVITVLSQETMPYAEEIFRYFDERKISLRFLPFYNPPSGNQPYKATISEDEIVESLKKLFDCWLASENASRIWPLEGYLDDLVNEIQQSKDALRYYDREKHEWTWVINTDGGIFAYDDEYKPEYCYGNILTDSVEQILGSQNRMKLVEESRNRIQNVCNSCSHFGYCSGYYVGDDISPSCNEKGEMVCGIVKPVMDYMYQRLEEEDLIKDIKQSPQKRKGKKRSRSSRPVKLRR